MSDRRLLNTKIKIRKEENEDKMILEGKAVAFESPETYDGETEVIDKGALNECDMSDVVLRYNHNDNQYTLARTRNKSLKLDLREDGLYFTAELIPTTTNKDAYLMVKEGLVDKCSFAFTIKDYSYDEKTRTLRILAIDRLFDVAIVDFPFYSDTSVEVKRSLDTRDNLRPEIERIKRERLANRLLRDELLNRL